MSSVTCEASLRVGTRTSADGRGSSVVVRSTIGTANASVLPEPVGDLARTSRPASASGRTSSWIRNGWWIERAASATTTSRDAPSLRKDCCDMCCPTPYWFEICLPRDTRRRNEKLISPGDRIADRVVRVAVALRGAMPFSEQPGPCPCRDCPQRGLSLKALRTLVVVPYPDRLKALRTVAVIRPCPWPCRDCPQRGLSPKALRTTRSRGLVAVDLDQTVVADSEVVRDLVQHHSLHLPAEGLLKIGRASCRE